MIQQTRARCVHCKVNGTLASTSGGRGKASPIIAHGAWLVWRRAVDKRIKDDDTGVVYFEFRPDGSYRGLSYYFAPGNGCGFCTSEVVSTVKLSGGKLAGALKGTEKDRPLDVSLNVPVMSDEHGTALPADGGAPGAAYLAYHMALVKRDRAALQPLLSLDRQQSWAD